MLPLYIFFQRRFYVDGLVGHHEVLADVSLGSCAHLSGGILDFANDKASRVPAENVQGEVRRGGQGGEGRDERSLLRNLHIGVAFFHSEVRFDLKIHSARLKRKHQHLKHKLARLQRDDAGTSTLPLSSGPGCRETEQGRLLGI